MDIELFLLERGRQDRREPKK